jgi:hypothetical protein
MLRTALRISIASVLLATSMGLVVAQVRETQKTKSAGSTIRAKSILGSKVHLEGNVQAGIVEDIVLDDEGVIDYFIVSDGSKLVTVPWEAVKFNLENRTVVINITQERYRQIPTYTVERYPDFYTPVYRTEVYKHWGLTPGQERRFERRINRK